jgi:arylsulfatase A-like enzyme
MGHNSTVYDEMLHVPLIIRLGDSIPEYVDTDALVTLADVVPTVLGRVGIQTPDALVGSDLFASNTFALERSLVARTSGQRPWFGYRTTAWKMIANDQDLRNWKVYDLEADPEETENLASESFDTALCLAALLRDGMTESRLQLTGGEVSELSSEDEKALRALGYVR